MRAEAEGHRALAHEDAAEPDAWHGVLEGLTDSMAVLDRSGRIVAVNRAWTAFGTVNGADDRKVGIGSDYLAVCDAGGCLDDPIALEVGTALRALLAGTRAEFECVYSCHAPDERRWFSMRVSVLEGVLERHLIVVHHDMTESHQLESAVQLSLGAFGMRSALMSSVTPVQTDFRPLVVR